MNRDVTRQVERRKRFGVALTKMPNWETWVEEIEPSPRILTPNEATSMYEAGMLAVTDVISENAKAARFIHHMRIVPRRVRRSMARDLAKREFRAERGL